MACKYAHSNSGSSVVSSSKSVFPGRPSITERMGIFQGLNEIFQSDLFLINEARYYRIEWGGSVLKLMNGISLNWYRFFFTEFPRFLSSFSVWFHRFGAAEDPLVLERRASLTAFTFKVHLRRLLHLLPPPPGSLSSPFSSPPSFRFPFFLLFSFPTPIYGPQPPSRVTASRAGLFNCSPWRKEKKHEKKSQSQKKVNDKKEPTLATFLEISHS